MDEEQNEFIEEKSGLNEKQKKILIILGFTGLILFILGMTKKKELIIQKPIKTPKEPKQPVIVNINNSIPDKEKNVIKKDAPIIKEDDLEELQ